MKKHILRGFTLVELLVVIGIITVLTGIVLVSVNPARQESRDTRRQTDLSQIAIDLKLYREKEGSYPASDGIIGTGGTIDGELAPFMSSVPADPRSGDAAFDYYYDSAHNCNGSTVAVVFAKSMEVPENSNVEEMCDGIDNWGTEGMGNTNGNPFIIILN